MGGHLDAGHLDTGRVGSLPWPDGWAGRTFGPQFRPAIVGGVACLLFAGAAALTNPADGLLLAVFALGMFVWALRPAPATLSDPAVLYHALHFYLDNPHARHELAGPGAVDRIRAARVDPADV